MLKRTHYQNKLSTDTQRKDWFLSDKKNNFAIICGEISNNLFVVDVDDNQLGDSLKKVFPETTTVQPSKGLHFYLFSKKAVKKRRLDVDIHVTNINTSITDQVVSVLF